VVAIFHCMQIMPQCCSRHLL